MYGITIAGAGALGTGLAALLGTTNAVTLLARPTTQRAVLASEQLRVGGARPTQIRLRAGTGSPGWVGVISDPTQIPEDDAVIFATKAPQLEEFVVEIGRRWKPAHGWVAGLQNGIGKDDVLINTFGADAVVGAATMTAAGRDPDGEVSVTSISTTYFGEFNNGLSERVSAVAEAFRRADLPVEVTADIRSLLWTKCSNTIGMFAASSLSRLDTGTILGRSQSVAAYLDLVEETATLARALGTEIGDFEGLPLRSYLEAPRGEVIRAFVERAREAGPPTTPSYTSMARDVIAGRPTEVDFVFGDLVRRAAMAGIAVPRIALAHDLIAAMDPDRQRCDRCSGDA